MFSSSRTLLYAFQGSRVLAQPKKPLLIYHKSAKTIEEIRKKQAKNKQLSQQRRENELSVDPLVFQAYAELRDENRLKGIDVPEDVMERLKVGGGYRIATKHYRKRFRKSNR